LSLQVYLGSYCGSDLTSYFNAVECSTSAVASGDGMPVSKTATLTFRIDPSLKEALRTAANLEHRSIANMVEILIRNYCGQRGIEIPVADEAIKAVERVNDKDC